MNDIDKAFYDLAVAERNAAWHEIDVYRAALSKACIVIEALAGQQAMPDDFYVAPLEQFKRLTA